MTVPFKEPFKRRSALAGIRVLSSRWLWLAVLMASLAFLARAHLAPEIGAGLQWLGSQVLPGGSLKNESQWAGTSEQARLETHETLSLLGQVAQPLREWLGLAGDGNTEYLARRVLHLAIASQPDAGLLGQLSTRQNVDGGFGGAPGYASHPLDTALAILAYGKSGGLSGEQTRAALAYLVAARNADGGWGKRGSSSVYDTATIIMAATGTQATLGWPTKYAVQATAQVHAAFVKSSTVVYPVQFLRCWKSLWTLPTCLTRCAPACRVSTDR